MSRICGIIRPGWSREQVSAARDRLIAPLVHSSDFGVDCRCFESAAFGRTFLKPLNFSTHLYVAPDGSVACAFTGYLFDPEALKKQVLEESSGAAAVSDPAALFAFLYPRYRSRMLANLSGSYVFAIWENASSTLTLGTDRYGMTRLYYRRSGVQFSFASEIKSLLALDPDSEVNLPAVADLLILGSPYGDHTLYPSIRRLPPATVLAFSNGDISTEQYWSHGGVHTDPNLGLHEYVEEAGRLLGRSVTRLTDQIARPMCFLSAGYDSRRLLFELVRQGKLLTAYTAPTVQHDSPYTIDVPIANALCSALGVPHVTAELPPTGCYGDLARYSQTLLDYETDTHAWILPLLAKIPVGAGVNFDGLGGDVLYQFNWTFADEAAHLDDPAYLARAVLKRYPDLWSDYFRIGAPKPSLFERLEQTFRNYPKFDGRYTMFYFVNWTRRKTALFSEGLLSLKFDSVYPFLDYDLVDHVFRFPAVQRRAHEISKAMLKLANPEVMQLIPTSHDDNIISGTGAYHDSARSLLTRNFRTSLPRDYWLYSQASIYRAAAVDIMKTGGVPGQLSRKTQLSAMAHLVPCPNTYVPRGIVQRSWRLPLAGLYARQRRTSRSASLAARRLDEARSYVYGR